MKYDLSEIMKRAWKNEKGVDKNENIILCSWNGAGN